MNVYVWESVEGVTDSYHNGGGIVVVADSLERARELIAEPICRRYCFRGETHEEHECDVFERGSCTAMKDEPDAVMPLAGDQEERLFVFPDAGCC